MDYQIFKDGTLVGNLIDITKESKFKGKKWKLVDNKDPQKNNTFKSIDQVVDLYKADKFFSRISLFSVN